jgi:hypothetical protein
MVVVAGELRPAQAQRVSYPQSYPQAEPNPKLSKVIHNGENRWRIEDEWVLIIANKHNLCRYIEDEWVLA